MRRKIVYVLVCMLFFTTVTGAMSYTNTSTKSLDKENANADYSHTIFGEYGTYTTCEPCKYAHAALKNLFFIYGEHPFYYITYVYDQNKRASQRIKGELGLIASPTVFWDGDYRKDVGASDTESAMAIYNTSIIECGERDVADIDLSLDVTWLGGVNPDPKDGATDVGIDGILNWTSSEMGIEVTVDNNGGSQYKGHLHVQVCDNLSSMGWCDTFNDLYSMAFLDYAFNYNFDLDGGGTLEDSTTWDGYDYNDGYGHPFKNITQHNTWVIATVFNRDNSFYSDETTGVRAGFGTDPKFHDVYFGNINPPPKAIGNISGMTFWNGTLNFSTTYYWKIVEWDSLGSSTPGQIWSFTTRGNSPPYTPHNPQPWNNSEDIPINTTLSWTSGDPDGDNVTYDIYFGKMLGELELVAEDYTNTTYDPWCILEFNTWYKWQIVAKDEWHLYKPDWIYNATGSVWNFKTQKNEPPHEPSDPYPPDGANDVLLGAILNWTGGDPNPGDVVTYDVYFSRTDPPTKKESNQTQTFYDPGDLEEYEDYYWKIVAWDSMGLTSEGERWTFKTGENHKPNRPTITGPTEVKVGEVHAYNFSTTDPDGQNISYYIEWGDETNTGWLGPYASGTTIKLNHSWDEKGKFDIRCQAKDHPNEAESDWGKLSVTVPKTKQSAPVMFYQFLQKLIQRFPLLEKVFLSFPFFSRIMNGGSQSTEAPLNNDYVNAYWNFDTGSGDTAYDSSGHGYDGIINGASWTDDTPSGDGYALDFDGVNDYVDLNTHSEDVSFNKIDDLIFSFWFKTSSTDTGMIYSLSNSLGTNPAVHIFLDNGIIGFTADVVGCGFTMYSNGIYNDGNWHYIKIIYHGSTSKPTVELYVDDEFDNSITEWVCPFYDDEFTRIKIGRRSHNSTNHFDGLIDEPKIIKYSGGNQQPDRVDIDGPTFGLVNEKLTFTFVTNDTENDTLYYQIDWGDGEITPWIGPKQSGEEFNESHSWSEKGTYEIKAKAKDFWHNGWWTEPPFRVSIGNHAPEKPEQPDGPTIGIIDVEYTYSTSTIDVDGDRIYYNWSWGDGIFSGWLGPYDSGVICEASHAWSEIGIYKVEVKARDEIAESLQSDPLDVSIVIPDIEIGEITGGWFKVKAVIKNTGEWDAENVTWTIDLVGGFILSGRNSLGEILSIPAGDETTVNSSAIFGFGKTLVVVTAKAIDGSSAEERDAFVFLIYIHIPSTL